MALSSMKGSCLVKEKYGKVFFTSNRLKNKTGTQKREAIKYRAVSFSVNWRLLGIQDGFFPDARQKSIHTI